MPDIDSPPVIRPGYDAVDSVPDLSPAGLAMIGWAYSHGWAIGEELDDNPAFFTEAESVRRMRRPTFFERAWHRFWRGVCCCCL